MGGLFVRPHLMPVVTTFSVTPPMVRPSLTSLSRVGGARGAGSDHGAVSDCGSVSDCHSVPTAGLCLNCWSLQELVSRDAGNYLILLEKILGKTKEVSGGCWGQLQALGSSVARSGWALAKLGGGDFGS